MVSNIGRQVLIHKVKSSRGLAMKKEINENAVLIYR
jgi:hypothetical protein